MSFGRLFRQQLKQALRRKEFTIALAVVMLLCLLSFLYYCKEFQGAERNSVFPAYDAFAGNYSVLGLAGNLKIFFPILAVLPFADSFLVDRKLGEQTLTLTRATPSRYYWAKGAAVFLSAFLVFFIPLLTNYLLNFLAFPIESYSHFGYDSSSGGIMTQWAKFYLRRYSGIILICTTFFSYFIFPPCAGWSHYSRMPSLS